ncbi:hypothetical protein [Bernardetia sp.]|uniref:hypothetical protein n=1 Tax=Bernardetia sp. TaxID=1937974 RepID=UPI0025C192FF|nr:hypothetical protein [Bernardetia sp.]
MRKYLKLGFYVGLVLLLMMFLLSISPLSLASLHLQIMYWQLCFYGFVVVSILCLYLIISSNDTNSRFMGIFMTILILLITGGLIYSSKPSRNSKRREGIFYNRYCIKKRKVLIENYLIWYEEVCN